MVERQGDIKERKIMPDDLFRHYLEGRRKAYAGGGGDVYVPDSKIPGFKVFNWGNPNLLYYFEDHYADTPKRPGNFIGFEINRENSEEGEKLTLYNYTGGLTEEGMNLGERAVYGRLVKFLGDHVEDVRFGKKVRLTIEDKGDTWVYEGSGEVKAWGWEDKETIKLNDIVLYELNGSGVCFIKGF